MVANGKPLSNLHEVPDPKRTTRGENSQQSQRKVKPYLTAFERGYTAVMRKRKSKDVKVPDSHHSKNLAQPILTDGTDGWTYLTHSAMQ